MKKDFRFELLDKVDIELVVPMIQKLSNFKVSETILKQRFKEMATQNYECAVVYKDEKLIGVCGMWFCTRHYSGKSIEIDHVFIEEAYRNQGLGKKFMHWVYEYANTRGVEAIELNTYVQNHASHKFYINQGFRAMAYHFVKPLAGKWPGE